MLSVFHVERPSEEGAPWVGNGAIWLFWLCVRFEKFVEY